MIRGTAAFVLLLLLALLGAGARRRLRKQQRGLPGLQTLATVLTGMLLGRAGLGLFPGNLLELLRPVILLGLTWIGLLIGLQFDVRILGRLEPWQRWTGFLVPLLTGTVTGGAALGAGLSHRPSLLLAAAAAVSSPRILDHLSRSHPPADRSAMRLLLMAASLSSTPAILLFGVGSTALMGPGGVVAPGISLVLGGGMAVLLGYATILLLRGEKETIHVLAFLVGITALTAGGAALTGMEPMLMAAVTGAVVANRSRFPHRILRAAHAMETPMLTAVLLLLGAWWRPTVPSFAALTLLTAVRNAALLGGGAVLRRTAARRGVTITVWLPGMGLLPEGPLALAFLMSFIQMGHGTPALAGGVFLALVCNHLAGTVWTRRFLFADPPSGTGVLP